MNQEIDSEFLTTAEIAKRLKVTGRTIQNWTADGTIPSVKIGRIRRYLWSEVREVLLAEYRVHSAPDESSSKR